MDGGKNGELAGQHGGGAATEAAGGREGAQVEGSRHPRREADGAEDQDPTYRGVDGTLKESAVIWLHDAEGIAVGVLRTRSLRNQSGEGFSAVRPVSSASVRISSRTSPWAPG